jgi:hypothetical protein
MPESITSWLSTAPATSQLQVPTKLQQTNAINSRQTEPETNEPSSAYLAGYKDVDWKRLQGYRIPDKPRDKASWIKDYGWFLWDSDNYEYWLCKACHLSKKMLSPKGHIFRSDKATTTPSEHLKGRPHWLQRDGSIYKPPLPKRRKIEDSNGWQRSGSSSTSAIQNTYNASFDPSEFRATVLEWITEDNVHFRKLDSPALRRLFEYLNPKCAPFIPSHQSIARWLDKAYNQQIGVVTEHLNTAASKINISFDMWTSRNKLCLLGVVAHFLDRSFTPRTILLALPRHKGSHHGKTIAETFASIISYYNIQDRLGAFVCDNDGKNMTCGEELAREFGFDWNESLVRCIGHVLNLVYQAVLSGRASEGLEEELIEQLDEEERRLLEFRKRGPGGKLHNITTWIGLSTQRSDDLDRIYIRLYPKEAGHHGSATRSLIKTVDTRWHVEDDAYARAFQMREAIDELIDEQIERYNKAVRISERKGTKAPPKPSVIDDKLSTVDWSILARYHEILKPIKDEARKLEGSIGSNHGAIWQVLPAFERLLTHFENLRRQYPPLETIPSQDDELLTTEHHFSTNINLAWQKLDDYYTKTDATPLYVTAVVLHPRFKKKWFNTKWKERPDWLAMVDDKVNKMWSRYKELSLDELKFDIPTAATKEQRHYNDWSSDDEDRSIINRPVDELVQYFAEPRPIVPVDNPITWWISQLSRWPRLTAMALDVLTIPPMSDEPERKFSEAGNVVQPRRRRIMDTTLQSILSLKSWQRQGLITIDRTLWRQCTASKEPSAAPFHQDDDDDEIYSLISESRATTRAPTPLTTPSLNDFESIPLDD